MNSRILKSIYIVIAIGAVFGLLFLCSTKVSPRIISGDTSILVTVADTEALREQGLSGTPSLPKGTGKLFIFDTSGLYGFWMKDMQYAIDIVWIDESWKVVGIAEAVTPESYPEVFYPPTPIRYVLEVNAHEAAVDNLVVGTQLQFQR